MSARRVFVTGTAASTCCGVGTAALFTALRRGGGAGPCGEPRRFGPVTVDIADWVHATRAEDRTTLHLLAAVSCDLRGTLARLGSEALGIVIGNTSGHEEAYRRFYRAGVELGPARVNPALLPATLVNYQAAQLNNALGVMGQSTTISSGHSAGLEAVCHGALRLRLGRERAVLAGGVQALVGDPAAGPVPHDRESAPGEAVALLLLEAHDRAPPEALAEVLGWATASGAAGEDIEALAERISLEALAASGLDPGGVGAVFGAGGVAPRIFGPSAAVPAHTVAPVVGECLAAAGPLECLAAVETLRVGGAARPGACSRALVLRVGLDHSCAAMVLAGV